MKTILAFLLLPILALAQVDTVTVLRPNNTLRYPTNFFHANSNLMNASVAHPSSSTIRVDKSGSDTTGSRGNLSKPFLTITAAGAAAQSGDLIIVGPGSYAENLPVRSNISWTLSAGASVDGVVVDQPILSYNSSLLPSANTAAVTRIYGRGKIGASGINVTTYAANFDIDLATCDGPIYAGSTNGMLGTAKFKFDRLDTNFVARWSGTNVGDVYVNIPDMRGIVEADGEGRLYWQGNLARGTYYSEAASSYAVDGSGRQRGAVDGAGIALRNGAHLVGVGNIIAASDAISARTNCYVEWFGNLRSRADAGIFVQDRSTAVIHGDVESVADNGEWQLAGNGAGIFCGAQTNSVTVYGRVRGLMPVVAEHGSVKVFGSVSYWNPYNVTPTYRLYTNEVLYNNTTFIPVDIANRFGSGINNLGTADIQVYGPVSGKTGSNAVWNASTGTVTVYGVVGGPVTNSSGTYRVIDPVQLAATGTINATTNAVDWTQLKSVPHGGDFMGAGNTNFPNIYITNNSSVGTIYVRSNLVMQGPAWDDSMVPAIDIKLGVVAPNWAAFAGGPGFLYHFENNHDDEGHCTLQFRHNFKLGQTNVYPHVHWAQDAAPGAPDRTNVVWELAWTWANIGGVFGSWTTNKMTNSISGTNYLHQISGFDGIVATNKGISSIFVARIRRLANSDGADNYDNDVSFLGFDVHYMIDGLGSDSATSKSY